jgi:hypothetical protein
VAHDGSKAHEHAPTSGIEARRPGRPRLVGEAPRQRQVCTAAVRVIDNHIVTEALTGATSPWQTNAEATQPASSLVHRRGRLNADAKATGTTAPIAHQRRPPGRGAPLPLLTRHLASNRQGVTIASLEHHQDLGAVSCRRCPLCRPA